jgi:aromatic ring hydroxylase
MGRTPDYMNVTYAGFAGRADEWGANGSDRGAANLIDYQKLLARKDISLTHTIVHPTIDKATGDAPAPGNDVALHKVADTAHGVVVRGARILATLAPFADELAVYPAHPLPEGADAYALSFCIPMGTPGLKFLCRDSCSTAPNLFDRPLSSRFDEQDAFVIFDDVEVPRHRVFIDGDLDVYNSVMGPTAWWPNIMQQTTLRALTKLEFAYGLASRMAEAVNDATPATLEMLGELLGYMEVTRSAVLLAEEHAYDRGEGVWFPDARPLHPMRAILATWFPRVNDILLTIGSHNLLATPSRAMLDDARLRPLIDEFLHGTEGVDAEARAALYRLAWDFVGSNLGARNELYERNYLASAKTNRTLGHLVYADRTRPYALVDAMLAAGRA